MQAHLFDSAPLMQNKRYDSLSLFSPATLLDNARRQKALPFESVPTVCVLDPDGDIVRQLLKVKAATRSQSWACYHTDLFQFFLNDMQLGIIGCAVGGPFAVLLAEELFASGCDLLISVTSAGQILRVRRPPYFVLIDRALRDEGVSYHYLPPARYSNANPALANFVVDAITRGPIQIERGAVWTTDAPFRETEEAIAFAEAEGILAVEMEAASLYAFSEARSKPVICFAQITNQMGEIEADFEKGEADGSVASLAIIGAIARHWTNRFAKETRLGEGSPP